MRGQVAEDPLDGAVAHLARRQHGIVGGHQLLAVGLGQDAIDWRVKRRRLHRIHRGVYAVGHLALTRYGAFMAAVLAAGEGAALSHFSAALVWGILEDRAQMIHVTAGGRRRIRGAVVHVSPLEGERVRRQGIVVTTPARTLVDLADVVKKRRTLERAFDEAEYLQLAWQSAAPRHGRNGAGLLASVLAVHDPGTTRTLSELEERFLAFCDGHGFRRPEVNSSIEGYLCDFVWREERLVVETDGVQAHGTRRAIRRDPVRDADLQLAGWRVIRVSSVLLLGESAGLERRLERMLRPAPAVPAALHPP